MLDISIRIGHDANRSIELGQVHPVMKKLRARRRGRQKVTGDEVSDAMVHVGSADSSWIGAATMALGMAWNWLWHRKRNNA